MNSSTSHHRILVPALDTLIGDPDIINPTEAKTAQKAEQLVIPYGYLARIRSLYSESTTRGDSCRELTRHFGVMRLSLKDINRASYTLPNGTIVKFFDTDNSPIIKDLDPASTSAQAIYCAKLINDSVAIWTGSDPQIVLAAAHDVDIAPINADQTYTGRRTVYLSFDDSAAWYGNNDGIPLKKWQQMYPDEPPLHPNEFIEFDYEGKDQNLTRNFANIGRFDARREAIVHLKYVNDMPYGLYPKTAGQAMLNEALLADPNEIPIVITNGAFGTGKTFLTVANGLAQVEKNGHPSIYDGIFICSRDGSLGERIGFLPGDKNAKIKPKAAPIADNLREILKKKGRDKLKKGKNFPNDDDVSEKQYFDKAVERYFADYFEFEALAFMGGRSLPNLYLIYDEFQDMERGQAKAILSRIGNNSKVIAMGDPTQVTNPHLSRTSNGLAYVTNKIATAYEPGIAVITLTEDEIVRSPAARAISRIFN